MGVVQKVEKLIGAFKNRLTLKALAKVSPGWGPRNSFRVALSRNGIRFPKVAKAQPWAGNWRTLSALFISHEFSHEWVSIRLFVQSHRS